MAVATYTHKEFIGSVIFTPEQLDSPRRDNARWAAKLDALDLRPESRAKYLRRARADKFLRGLFRGRVRIQWP